MKMSWTSKILRSEGIIWVQVPVTVQIGKLTAYFLNFNTIKGKIMFPVFRRCRISVSSSDFHSEKLGSTPSIATMVP